MSGCLLEPLQAWRLSAQVNISSASAMATPKVKDCEKLGGQAVAQIQSGIQGVLWCGDSENQQLQISGPPARKRMNLKDTATRQLAPINGELGVQFRLPI